MKESPLLKNCRQLDSFSIEKNIRWKFTAATIALVLLVSCSAERRTQQSETQHFVGGEENSRESDPSPDRSIGKPGRYYGVAKNLFTGDVFCDTGETAKEARDLVLEQCRDFSQDRAGCNVQSAPVNNALIPRESGQNFASWVCLSEETASGAGPENFRSWVSCDRRAQSRSEAVEAALKQCRQFGASGSCRISRCFNSDQDKRFR